MNWLKSNVWEIQRSPLLCYLGAIYSILHFINYFYWSKISYFIQSPNSAPILCWNFYQKCTSQPVFSHSLVSSVFTGYLVLSVLACALFLSRRFVFGGWIFLMLLTVIKLGIYFFDASLALDIHGLILFLSLGFLFVPNKAQLTRFTLVAFYVISGVIDLNPDFLSGVTLQGIYPLPLKGLEWIAGVGILVKWTLPLILITPIGQRLALSTSLLFIFHAFHFYFKRDFESLAMGLFIIYFILDFFERARLERESLYQSYALPEPSKLWWPVFLSLYIVAQTHWVPQNWPIQFIRFSGSTMVAQCEQITFAHFQNHVEQITDVIPKNIKDSLKCHRQVAYNSARRLCTDYKQNPEFQSLSTYFMVRGIKDKSFQLQLTEENICKD